MARSGFRLRPIHLYVASVSLLAIGFLSQGAWKVPDPASGFWNTIVAFILLGLVSEASFLRLSIGTATSSVAFVPYLAAIIMLPAEWAMLIGGVTFLIAETVIRRKPTIKVVHNTAKEIVALGTSGWLYLTFRGVPSLHSLTLNWQSSVAFTVAVSGYFLISSGSTATAIALSNNISMRESWRKLVGGSLLFDFLSSPLALLLAYLYMKLSLIGLVIVVIPLFLVRHIYSMNLQLEQVTRDLLELMVKAIEARDPYTSGHSLRVSRIAGVLARELGLPPKHVSQVETAALLHDVGKIHEEYAPILRKEGRLTSQEAALMKTHAIRSYELVHTISGFRGGVDLAVRHHHENVDGSGYPDGLVGDAIPIGARIIMVADTTDAMMTDRPYRKALSYDRVIDELRKYQGAQFDDAVVAAFCRSVEIRRLVTAQKAPGARAVDERPGMPAQVVAL